MGNKNTHDKLLNPTPTNDKTRHQKESRDSDVLQEGKKKNKRNRSPHKDKKNTNEQTIKKNCSSDDDDDDDELTLAMWVRIEIDG
jgi:hypothetical protein